MHLLFVLAASSASKSGEMPLRLPVGVTRNQFVHTMDSGLLWICEPGAFEFQTFSEDVQMRRTEHEKTKLDGSLFGEFWTDDTKSIQREGRSRRLPRK